MIAAVVYDVDQWRDFFVMVGGAAAVLTGLVFVAMSLSVEGVARDATHRYRSIGTLTGMTSTFVLCAFALMGHPDHRVLGAEWLVVTLIAAAVYVNGYVQAVRLHGSEHLLRVNRVLGAGVLYVLELVGSALLIVGFTAGLYLAASTLILLLAYMISGAWLLVIGSSARPDQE